MSNNSDFEFFKKWFGKEVEFNIFDDEWTKYMLSGYDEVGEFPVFITKEGHRLRREYVRPIQEPTYKPYTLETVPWPLSFRHKVTNQLFTAIIATEVIIECGGPSWLYKTLLEKCEHLDGSPCGVLEEGEK
jgi:hypothetical protein